MNDYNQPPPAKKPAAQQNPQMNRITNNLSSMLTNALKAQVSKVYLLFPEMWNIISILLFLGSKLA